MSKLTQQQLTNILQSSLNKIVANIDNLKILIKEDLNAILHETAKYSEEVKAEEVKKEEPKSKKVKK